ncbi:MAG: hypothetical protein KDF59_08190 [Nitrosomonas sp.]|nr:hypothetical protein [Nitrosomonas sp.]
MDAYIVNPNAYTCLDHGIELLDNLFSGNCGLSAANSIYPDYFPENTTKIGAIRGLKSDESRLLQILRAIGSLIPEQAKQCQLILGASSLGDLEGRFAGDPYGCIQYYLASEKPELAPLYKGVISSACSSGTDVLSMAALMVDQHKYDVIGVLAVDCLDRGKLLQHVTLGTQGPDCAKPFDVNRDGTSFGEGGGFAIVANKDGLEQLNTKQVYNIRGFGMSCDAQHITAPDETGEIPALAISRALNAASLAPSDIGYINAHASGTTLNDQVESIAYRKVFGKALDSIGVSGTKGAIGHLLGATGLVEAILTCWALSVKRAPGTIGLKDKDETLNIPAIVGGDFREISRPVGISTTFGFGGVNSAIVIESLN